MAPTFLFLIDVGPAAMASGVTASACDAVKRVLPCLAGGPRALVAVATFDSVPHFFKLRAPGSPPHMLIVADAAAPSAPAPAAQLLVSAQERLGDLEALLDAIPAMFATPRGGGCALGAGLKAAAAVLSGRGGRVIAFAASIPSTGFGALQPRPGGPDSEAPKALSPGDPAYVRLAADAAEQQVAFDLFLAPPAPGQAVDVATLGVLPSRTGGSLYRYAGYTPALDFAQLHNDLAWSVSRPQAFEAVARLRASTGLELAGDAQGYFAKRAPADLDLPALDCDKALLLRLSIEERLRDGGDAVLQCALLYSTPEGSRRIRVHTLALPITGALAGVFRAADLDTCVAAAARKAAAELLRGPASPSPATLRDRATADAVSALHAYRRYCASNSSAGQLILPEALKLLPLFTLGLLKAPGLRPDSPPDERAAWALRTLASPADAAMPAVYSRLFDVAALPEPEGPDDTDGDDAAIPGTDWLSSERLRPDGVVLLENGCEAFLHVGASVPPGLLVALFGTEAPASGAPLPMLRTPQSRALARLLRAVRRHRGGYMRLRVVRRPDPAAEAAFFRLMIEDRSADGMSYVEYLCAMHRQIQSRFN
jgi:protein transport protein SEC24